MEIGKTPDELYRERLKRVEDAIQLKAPDRVPFLPRMGFLAAPYAGLSSEEAFSRSDRWLSANRKLITEVEPDMYKVAAYVGQSLEAVDCRQLKWPGHGGPANSSYQYVEKEYMKAEEYDAFLDDPSDFLVRTYLPRIFGTLEPLRKLPSLPTLFAKGYNGATSSAAFADPEMAQAFMSLYKAGVEARRYRSEMAALDKELRVLGFPKSAAWPNLNAPFDTVADMFRGIKGTMMDMYRQPDKLLAMIDKLLNFKLREDIAKMKKTVDFPAVEITLHLGADGFMSAEQFETFYWPSLKKMILALISEGITPCPFLEGDWTTRLRYFTDLPKGKVMLYMGSTDLAKTKDILGGITCLAGNMPLSILHSGTPEQVRAYSKKLIDEVGKGGGFIMSSRGAMDDARPELVKVWAEFTREYGVYE